MTYRWGIVGPGGIARRFADAMRDVENGEIVAVASRAVERADAFADRYGIARRYGDADDLAGDPDVDIVYVATPHARHEADALRFIGAGKHVLCEKPFALNARQAQRMVNASRAQGVFLMEAMWSRFLPSFRALVGVLAEGRIGEVLFAESDFGFRRPVASDHRLFDPAAGGGALLDLGIYPVQLCSLVLGAPDRVVADGVVGATGVDEQVAAVLHHESGALGVVKAAVRVGMTCTARIAGTDGWIELPAFAHCPDFITVGTARGAERIDGAYDGDGLRFEIDAVQRCLADGLVEHPLMPLAETIRIASTLDAIRAQVGVVYPGD